MRIIAPTLLCSSLLLVACGDDGGGTSTDAKEADANANCTVSSASFGNRGALAGASTWGMGGAAGVGDIRAILPLEAASPSDILIVEFYTGFAPFGTSQAPTAVVPGTYQLTGSQLQYADCGVCLRIGTNADSGTGMYEDDYMVTGGTVTVTAVDNRVGGNLAFTLSNLQFEHATIDPDSFMSTPVGDGCNSSISGAMHMSTMAAPPANKLTAGTLPRKHLGL